MANPKPMAHCGTYCTLASLLGFVLLSRSDGGTSAEEPGDGLPAMSVLRLGRVRVGEVIGVEAALLQAVAFAVAGFCAQGHEMARE